MYVVYIATKENMTVNVSGIYEMQKESRITRVTTQ